MDLNAGEDMTKLRQILSGKGWGHIDWTAFSENNQDFTYDVVEDIQWQHSCKYNGGKLNLYN